MAFSDIAEQVRVHRRLADAQIAGTSNNHPSCSHFHNPGNDVPFSVSLLNVFAKRYGSLLGLETSSEIGKEVDESNGFLMAYQFFYAQWDLFLGPNRFESIAPATPFAENMEALMFPVLFPYRIGHWLGPNSQHSNLPFEEYVQHRLAIVDTRFQKSSQWLTWTLTRTEDRDTIAMVNCVLVGLHRIKARHLGGGAVQTLSINEDFEECELLEGKLVPKEDSPSTASSAAHPGPSVTSTASTGDGGAKKKNKKKKKKKKQQNSGDPQTTSEL